MAGAGTAGVCMAGRAGMAVAIGMVAAIGMAAATAAIGMVVVMEAVVMAVATTVTDHPRVAGANGLRRPPQLSSNGQLLRSSTMPSVPSIQVSRSGTMACTGSALFATATPGIRFTAVPMARNSTRLPPTSAI